MGHKIEDFKIGDIVSFRDNKPTQGYGNSDPELTTYVKGSKEGCHIFHGNFNNSLHKEGFTGIVMFVSKKSVVVKCSAQKSNSHGENFVQLDYDPDYFTIVSKKEPIEELLTQIL